MSPSTRLDSSESRPVTRSQHAVDAGAEPFGTRHRDREQKRFAVLTAAADLFISQGYRQTRLDDIAERLTITKPALYNYFRSKQDILLGCHMLGHDIFDRGFEDIERAGGDGASRLSNLFGVLRGG